MAVGDAGELGGMNLAAGLARRVPAELHDAKQNNSGWPLPKWCLALRGVPTFYMPSVYLALAVCVPGFDLRRGWALITFSTCRRANREPCIAAQLHRVLDPHFAARISVIRRS